MVIWLVLAECVCGCYSMNEFHPDIPLYLYLYLNSIFTNIRSVWVCGGVISLDLPLHQPPTSESCLPVALDCREEGRHRRNQNTQMFSQLVERTFEWKERNWGKCWTWLFERLSGINQGPGWIYWTAVSHLTFTFNQFSFLTLTNSLFRNFRFPRYHHPASDSH